MAGAARAVTFAGTFAVLIGATRLGWASSVAQPVGPSVEPRIIGGTLAASPTYALALCEGEETWFNCVTTCGASLVAPNLVVTSRHCVDVVTIDALDCATYRFSGTLKSARSIWVTVASPVSNAARFHRGLRWDTPLPSSCGNDLAFLTLEDPIPADESAPATPAFGHAALPAGELLDVYGYGRTGPDAPVDARRRSVKARVLCNGGSDSCKAIAGADLLATELALDVVVCPGDSGSGAFDSGGRLLGALARSIGGMKTCAYGVYSRLGAHALLLARVARHAAELASYPPPAWIAEAEATGNDPHVTPRAFGASCDGAADCTSAECRSYDGGLAWSCARPCADGCGDGTCRSTEDGDFCFASPAPSPMERGCRAGIRGPRSSAWEVALALLALVFARRRA